MGGADGSPCSCAKAALLALVKIRHQAKRCGEIQPGFRMIKEARCMIVIAGQNARPPWWFRGKRSGGSVKCCHLKQSISGCPMPWQKKQTGRKAGGPVPVAWNKSWLRWEQIRSRVGDLAGYQTFTSTRFRSIWLIRQCFPDRHVYLSHSSSPSLKGPVRIHQTKSAECPNLPYHSP